MNSLRFSADRAEPLSGVGRFLPAAVAFRGYYARKSRARARRAPASRAPASRRGKKTLPYAAVATYGLGGGAWLRRRGAWVAVTRRPPYVRGRPVPGLSKMQGSFGYRFFSGPYTAAGGLDLLRVDREQLWVRFKNFFLPRWKPEEAFRRFAGRVAAQVFSSSRERRAGTRIVRIYRPRRRRGVAALAAPEAAAGPEFPEDASELTGDDASEVDAPEALLASALAGPRVQLPLLGRIVVSPERGFNDVIFTRVVPGLEVPSGPALHARILDREKADNYWADRAYLTEFIKKKKEIVGARVFNDRTFDWADRIPNKFFFLNHSVDPVYGSYFLNKLTNVFSRGGDKRRIRRILYEWLMREKDFYSPDMFYYLIEFLRPEHLNVIARRGRDVYRAPIPASYSKSSMKALKFFKSAVRARRYDKSLFLKFFNELNDFYT